GALGAAAARRRARVTRAVVRAGRAVAHAIVPAARDRHAVRVLSVGTVDRLTRARGRVPALAAEQDVGRRRVALHRRRIVVAVVVDRAELEPPRSGVVTVERQRRFVDELRRIVVGSGDHDRRRRLGDAGIRLVSRSRLRPSARLADARLGYARTPDAEESPTLVRVGAEVRDARALPVEDGAAVLDLIERRDVLDEDAGGVEGALERE